VVTHNPEYALPGPTLAVEPDPDRHRHLCAVDISLCHPVTRLSAFHAFVPLMEGSPLSIGTIK
jgi:hypothetical protein